MTSERRPLGGALPYAHYDRRRKYKTVSIEEGYAICALQYGDFYDRFDVDLFERSPLLIARTPGSRVVERGVYEHTLVADVTATGLPEASFDGAITSMAVCHVPDLHAFFCEAGRVLRPGGWLAVLDYHPFFLFMGRPITHFWAFEK
jgi:SAM-dependent methyltransferase